MNLKEEIKQDTDIAWQRLYGRLENDGLLDGEDEKRPRLSGKILMRGVAAVALVAVCATAAYYFLADGRPAADRVVLNNKAGAPTLVTTLEDGTIIYLKDQASLEYPKSFGTNRREVALRGDAFFEVSRQAERPFIIDTQEATVEVLGTAFNIKEGDGKEFSLSVRQGEVRVTSKRSKESVHVGAGQTALLRPGRLAVVPTDDYRQFRAYMDHIHFKDQRLGDVVRFLNDNSPAVRFSIEPQLAGRHFTVTFYHNTPETMAMLICKALNLDYMQAGDTIYITQMK